MSKAALVTGGAKRIGKAIALSLAEAGYDIALHYNHSESEAKQLAAEITALGRACELIKADVASSNACGQAVLQAVERFPHLNVLINNASVFDRASFKETDAELLALQFDVNFQAPFFLTQSFARQVKEGVVINLIDSRVGRNRHTHFAYLLSKKALFEFTKMAAVELAPNIRVCGICPGFVLPSLGFEKDYEEQLKSQNPLKSIATVEDITRAVHTLIGTTGMTGQFIFLDGGEALL